MPESEDRMGEPEPSRGKCAADRKERILRSAGRLFSERRFDEVLIEDVAREAGVGKGTVYRYFSDKEELYFAFVFSGFAELKQQLSRDATQGLDPLEQLHAAIRSIVGFLSHNRFFFRLMTREDSSPGSRKKEYRERWKRERDNLVGVLAAVLEHGAKEEVLDVRHLRTEAQILLGMVRSTLRFNEENLSTDEIVEEITRVFLRGVQWPRSVER